MSVRLVLHDLRCVLQISHDVSHVLLELRENADEFGGTSEQRRRESRIDHGATGRYCVAPRLSTKLNQQRRMIGELLVQVVAPVSEALMGVMGVMLLCLLSLLARVLMLLWPSWCCYVCVAALRCRLSLRALAACEMQEMRTVVQRTGATNGALQW